MDTRNQLSHLVTDYIFTCPGRYVIAQNYAVNGVTGYLYLVRTNLEKNNCSDSSITYLILILGVAWTSAKKKSAMGQNYPFYLCESFYFFYNFVFVI